MGTKSERRAARQLVDSYYETELAALVERVAAAVDAYRAGTLDVYEVDDVLHHYKRAPKELWKFCWLGGGGVHIEKVARLIEEPLGDEGPIDWWQRGEPPKRQKGRTP